MSNSVRRKSTKTFAKMRELSSRYVPPAVVEGMLVSTLSRTVSSLDVLHNQANISHEITYRENILGCYTTSLGLAEQSIKFLTHYTDTMLSYRHACVRKVMVKFLERGTANDLFASLSEDTPNPNTTDDAVLFTRDLVEYISAFHSLFHADTTDEERDLILFSYGVS